MVVSDDGVTTSPDPIVIHATVLTEPRPTATAQGGHHVLTLVVELLKGLAWPLLALTFFLIFKEPIRRTIALVPDKLEKADKGNIGSLSWEIQQHAREQGGSDLARRVGTLSPAAIDALINAPRFGGAGILSSYGGIRDDRGYVLPSEERFDGFRELEAAQLLRFQEPLADWLQFLKTLPLREDSSISFPHGRTMILTAPLTPEQQRRVDAQHYELSPKGKQAVEAIVKALGEQLKAG
jgi:hypothetical protein